MIKLPRIIIISQLLDAFHILGCIACWFVITFKHKAYHRYGFFYFVIVFYLVVTILLGARSICKSREMISKSSAIQMMESSDHRQMGQLNKQFGIVFTQQYFWILIVRSILTIAFVVFMITMYQVVADIIKDKEV